MCAERTTNSFLRAGSEPESLATRLADSRDLVWITALAWSETAREKCGRGLRSFPRAASSAKVWVDLVKSCSADAGLKATPHWKPGGSLNSAPARSMDG